MTPGQQYEHEHRLTEPTDPREADYPDAYNETPAGVQIDPAKFILVNQLRSCVVTGSDGDIGIAFQLKGRMNQSKDEVAITSVTSVSALAKIVAQLIELAVSTGEEGARAFHKAMSEEMELQVANHQAYIEEREA